jgi:hypothetical protein
MCGFKDIENERRRRRQIALENDRKRQEERKEMGSNQNSPQHPPGHHGGQMQANYFQPQQPQMQVNNNPYPVLEDPYNPNNNAPYGKPVYNTYGGPSATPQPGAEPGPPVANRSQNQQQQKGFFDKVKDKVKDVLK